MTNDFLLHIGKKLKIFEYDLVKKKILLIHQLALTIELSNKFMLHYLT